MGWKTSKILSRLLLLTLCSAQWSFAAVSESAPAQQWGRDYFPNTPLINQDGQPVRFLMT